MGKAVEESEVKGSDESQVLFLKYLGTSSFLYLTKFKGSMNGDSRAKGSDKTRRKEPT